MSKLSKFIGKTMGYALVFNAGVVIALNLTHLVSYGEHYQAEWYKVGICVLCVFFGIAFVEEKGHSND